MVLQELIFHSFYYWEGVVVLYRMNFSQFLLWAGVGLEIPGGLEITDF